MLILLIRTFFSSVETDLSHLKLTSFTSVMFHETLEHKLWIFGPRHHKCTQRNRKDDLVWEEEADDIGNKFDTESEDEDCFVTTCFFLGFWLCLLLGKFGKLDFVG